MIAASDVGHRFGTATVLDGINLAIKSGSYTVLLGPSGSGKTTLLSILGGFLVPERGRVLIDGADCTAVPPAKRPTATVFQDYALFPHMTVGGNVAFGLRMKGIAHGKREAKAREMLTLVGLAEAFERKPHQLSGGQRQRVALARALAVEPSVLLLDEPLGALDLKLRRQMQDELKVTQKRAGITFVHVTHDQEEAMALADHVVVMNAGRIEDQGPPERVYARPATRFTATFMGESTILEGAAAMAFGLAGPAAVRPEHVTLGGTVSAVVGDVVFQGSYKRITARAHGTDVLARLPATAKISAGDAIMLSIDPAQAIELKS